MTTVTTGKIFDTFSNYGLDQTDNLFSAFHNATTDVVERPQSDTSYVFLGSGFEGVDGRGMEKTGTITEWDFWGNGIQFAAITDFSMPAHLMATIFATHDVGRLNHVLFDGDDILIAGSASILYGYGGNDIFRGSKSGDLFFGGKGDDTLRGAAGNDILQGNQGADTLTGGKDSDTFEFARATDSNTTHGIDLITDLENTDRIMLSEIDTNPHTRLDDPFHIVDHFTGVSGELTLHYDAANDRTVIEGDVNGDAIADLTIYAAGKHNHFTNFDL